jgi:hypothetical protein
MPATDPAPSDPAPSDTAPSDTGAGITVADRLEINELAARYGFVIDDRDWDGLATVFTDDAVFVLLGFPGGDVRLEGLTAIRDMMEHGRHPVAHHVTNVLVDVGPDGVWMRSKIIGSGAKGRVGSADYRDRLRRTGDGWRIAERVVTLRGVIPSPPAT